MLKKTRLLTEANILTYMKQPINRKSGCFYSTYGATNTLLPRPIRTYDLKANWTLYTKSVFQLI